MENELMFITVNIKDVIIDLMVETKKTNNTTEKIKKMDNKINVNVLKHNAEQL